MEKKGIYSKFWALLDKMPVMGMSREDHKDVVVASHTEGRTTHLSEMSPEEYCKMIGDMERIANMKSGKYRDALRKKRSEVLHQMQKMGIDTTDWARVNAFCEDGRMAGKPFGKMDTEELKQMLVKLHAIQRKGWLRKLMEENRTVTVLMGSIGEA